MTEEQLAKFRERFPVLPPTDEAWRERIVADPDDLELRMVYADVLLERGDPMGELVNIQCLLESELDADTRNTLEQRAAQLLGKVVVREKRWRTLNGWITHAVQDLGGTNCTIRAGFVNGTTVDANVLKDKAAALFAIAPIQSLVVTNASSFDVIAFARTPWITRLSKLTLCSPLDNRIVPIDQKALEALADLPLQSLSIDRGKLGPKALGVLGATALPKLTELELIRQPLRSVKTLLAWPGLARLERLALRECELADKEVVDLVTVRMDHLVALDLSSNDVGAPSLKALREPSRLPKLRMLRLEMCGVNPRSVTALEKARRGLEVRTQRDYY